MCNAHGLVEKRKGLMYILRHYSSVPKLLQGGVYALGNFDGVHRGHQVVIRKAASIAHSLSTILGVLVFEPHPKQFFFPDELFFRLSSFRTKVKLLEKLSVNILVALPFDVEMSGKLASEFVLDVLVEGLNVTHVVTGYDFRFGKARSGDVAALACIGRKGGIGVSIVNEVTHNGMACSSTHIRQKLADGDPRGAAELLGYWWTVETRVIMGDQRGRSIGFPTANLSLNEYVKIAIGVYAVRVEIEDGAYKGLYNGVANFGRRPTFDKKNTILEVHIFDFMGDIYGYNIAVSFIDYLRPEQKFDGIKALKIQIAKDSTQARKLLSVIPFRSQFSLSR